MLSQKDFEQLELVCRTAKENNLYFGGIQVVTSGDFYQLPPVPNTLYNESGNFCFQSEIWEKVMCHRVNLQEVVRQTEPELVKAVRETALGSISKETDTYLRSLSRPLPEDIAPVHLFARNIETSMFNEDRLQEMDGESKVYKATKNKGPKKHLKKILAPNYLHVKIGCPVILLRNLGGKLVNGLSGKIVATEEDAITVHFPEIGQTHKITRCLFTVYNPRTKQNVAEREQFPLTLGFAMTMHKAQGMTLDAVHVHCKNIFQAGQLSVGIGRVRCSKGLRIDNYRAGLCQTHKSCVTEFYRSPSAELSESLKCCRIKDHQHIQEEIEEETASDSEEEETDVDEESDNSDFDDHDNDIESMEDGILQQLPEYIDTAELITLVNQAEPVTETQRNINKTCQSINPTRLNKFCIIQQKAMSSLIPESNDEKTTPKVWSVALCEYHKYITSKEYTESISTLFGANSTQTKSTTYIASKITFEILKREIENLSIGIVCSSGQKGLPKAEISEPGKAKVRHVGGMCVAKARHQFMNAITTNLGNPAKNAREKVALGRKRVDAVQCLEADTDELDFDMDRSLDETERKMNVRRGLTHITDNCFSFFLVLNQQIRNSLDISSLKQEKQNILEKVRHELSENEELQMIWAELFADEHPVDIVFDVYTNVIERYLKVCYKQFLKETKDCLNVHKKKAHREEIAKKKEEKKTCVSVDMKEIMEDKSNNKESSHLKLKLNVMSSKQFLAGRHFTKTNLQKLCRAYDIKQSTGVKKDDLAEILAKRILTANNIPNSSAFNVESTETDTQGQSVCKKRRKMSNRPGKGKGRGKGKSNDVVYKCGLCKEEYEEGEEWVQCSHCDKWFHRTCCEIASEDGWQRIVSEVMEWTCWKCLQ